MGRPGTTAWMDRLLDAVTGDGRRPTDRVS